MNKIKYLPAHIIEQLKEGKLLLTASERTQVMMHFLKQPVEAITHGAVIDGSWFPGEKSTVTLKPGCRGFLIINPVECNNRTVGLEYLFVTVTSIEKFELVATACEYVAHAVVETQEEMA